MNKGECFDNKRLKELQNLITGQDKVLCRRYLKEFEEIKEGLYSKRTEIYSLKRRIKEIEKEKKVEERKIKTRLYKFCRVEMISPRYCQVLKMRIADGETLDVIKREFDITRERVRQIESKALKLLKHLKDKF